MHGFSTALTWERLFFFRVSARKVNTYSLLYHVLYIFLFISLLVKGYRVDTHRETLHYHQLWPYQLWHQTLVAVRVRGWLSRCLSRRLAPPRWEIET
ncbi:hypothetical protein BR93DRAFT_122404 [Coniochaeta sp. PMI_546]|nr:hypothetical protein BR93DRAFT_122404 [Coniochaeta sp. PMI_546]